MGNMFYLLNMRISGIKNIKDEIRIDFYKKTVDKNFNPDKYRIKAIYGENGSGKSAIVTAVKIFRELILWDNYLSESKTQGLLNEIINKTSQRFHFCLEFLVDAAGSRVIYNYSFEIAKGSKGLFEIQSENLSCKNGNYANQNYKKIFEAENGELLYINCSPSQRGALEKHSMNLLLSHSLIDIYIMNQDNLEALDGDNVDRQLFIHILMCLTLTIITTVYLGEEDQHELYFLRKKLADNSLEN